jgi:BirA family transcriptional regulator, biotin operon repressor / biotin---[acetyl-CoA-carboxylase] ligase
MKYLSPLQLQLLDCLADGNCHSGNAIGERIGVSRTAIWKQVSQLVDLGLDIKRIPQQGYQLTRPFIPISEELIRKNLGDALLPRPLNFHLFAEIDSTNRFLKDAADSKEISICCAEKQTKGRGRFGREWASPFGQNIYISSRWQLTCCLSKLSGLSLVVSLAILDSLQKSNIHEDIRVKWPNDLLWNHKKLCGVLIEINAESNGCAEVIIGIGLNVNTDTLKRPLTDKSWCSLYEITGNYFDRNVLIAELLRSLSLYLEQFMQNDFRFFQERWQQVDYLDGHYITVIQARDSLSGYANGVTEFGQLCLIDEAGKEHFLSSGDTSLHEMQ